MIGDEIKWAEALWKVRARGRKHVRMTVIRVQAIMLAIDDYAERETGRQPFSMLAAAVLWS